MVETFAAWRVAPLRAPRAHDPIRRRARARRRSPPTTRAPDTTCSPSPTTGVGPRRRRRRLARLPSAELNASSRRGRDGHVLGFGIDGGAAAARRRVRRARADGRLDRGARRRRLSRAPVLDRCGAGEARAAAERRRDRGLQRRVRARGRSWSREVHWDELLEAGRRCFGDCDGRFAPSRLRHRPGAGCGCARTNGPRGSARRARRGAFYSSRGLVSAASSSTARRSRWAPARAAP